MKKRRLARSVDASYNKLQTMADSWRSGRPRRRRNWTFEKLEDRHYLSATPLDEIQWQSLSSSDPNQAAEILWREMAWAAYQQGATTEVAAFTRALPDDTYFLNQWYLLNLGQQVGNPDFQDIEGTPGVDLNVVPVWDMGYTGDGVLVAVVDSGVQLNHPDLMANIHPTLRFDALTGDADPSPDLTNPANAHGTAVAGLIAGVENGVGTVGVAPEAIIVPIRLIDTGQTEQSFIDAFAFVAANGIDIMNNSWGPDDSLRQTLGPTDLELQALRDAIIFGRDGLGSIVVFASGNGGGPAYPGGWQGAGSYDASIYDGWVSSRYTIGVTGFDHDGLVSNADGTFTAYPEGGPSVLVAAPTASFANINVGDDIGIGSGIYTADLIGEDGYNALPLPSGFEFDRDFLADTNYTSRFNGTSAAAPLVSGVIALMLEANPNLSWRDVQEILVRSSSQVAQFETPQSGALTAALNSWRTIQWSLFRQPFGNNPLSTEPGFDPNFDPATQLLQPLVGALGMGLETFSDFGVPMYTNGSGYTVSDGFGIYGDRYGYGHGAIDAELAVKMAEQWHTKDQALADELTFTTFVVNLGADLPAAENTTNMNGNIIIPGGLGGDGGFADYWNEFFVTDNPMTMDVVEAPFDNNPPNSDPTNTRGGAPLIFSVPADNAMSVETVEVKVEVSGGDVTGLRILLVSPQGTYSELNPFYVGVDGTIQENHGAGWFGIDGLGDPDPDGDNFVWTFTTNRSWGERSDTALVYHPMTGEPANDLGFVATRDWQIHFDNYSDTDLELEGIEVVWHGTPIDPETYRIQGLVGIDENHDTEFNFDRVDYAGIGGDPAAFRLGNVQTVLDLNQESFASNVTVQAMRVSDGEVVGQFVTGADGNYYFDLPVDTYVISITEVDGVPVEDFLLEESGGLLQENAPAGYLPFYQQEWLITPDHFYAWDMDVIGNEFRANVDGDGVPIPFRTVTFDPDDEDMEDPIFGPVIPDHIRNINFLLDLGEEGQSNIEISGEVFADVDGNGTFGGNDATLPGAVVYADLDGSGAFEMGEPMAVTNAGGQYDLAVPSTTALLVTVGVIPPSSLWNPTNPATGFAEVIAFPGDPVAGIDFAIQPPGPGQGAAGSGDSTLLGVVFSDANGNTTRQAGEAGIPGFKVYADYDESGTHEAGLEPFTFSDANGVYLIEGVEPGSVRVAIEIPGGSNIGITTPAAGYHDVNLPEGGAVTNLLFGLLTQGSLDYGDILADGIPTLLEDGGPSHPLIAGFRLGARIDGEPDGQPTAGADGDDAEVDTNNFDDEDGVMIVDAGGVPLDSLVPGTNYLRVTVAGLGGLLQGWIDWNNSGSFSAGEQVFDNVDINPGTHILEITAPGNLTPDVPIFARFRWGEADLGVDGPAVIGEVEDYLFMTSTSATTETENLLPGDFNGDLVVDNADYAILMAGYGSTTNLAADANFDGIVNILDQLIWRDNLGMTYAAAAGVAFASGSSDEGVEELEQDAFSEELLARALKVSADMALQRAALVPNGEALLAMMPDNVPPSVAPGLAIAAESVSQALLQPKAMEALLGTPLFAGSMNDGASSALPARFAASSSAPVASGEALRLLDRVMADLAADRHVGPLWGPRSVLDLDREHESDPDSTDLALAAVLTEEEDWRSL